MKICVTNHEGFGWTVQTAGDDSGMWWGIGVYFRTQEAARRVADAIQEELINDRT